MTKKIMALVACFLTSGATTVRAEDGFFDKLFNASFFTKPAAFVNINDNRREQGPGQGHQQHPGGENPRQGNPRQ